MMDYLLLTVEHGKGKYEVVLCLWIIRAWISYDAQEFVEFEALLAVRKLLHLWSTRAGYLLWRLLIIIVRSTELALGVYYSWTVVFFRLSFAFAILAAMVAVLSSSYSIQFYCHLTIIRRKHLFIIGVQMWSAPWTSIIVLISLRRWAIHLSALQLQYTLATLSFRWLPILRCLATQTLIFASWIILHPTILIYDFVVAWVSFIILAMEVLLIILAVWIRWPVLIIIFRIGQPIVVGSHSWSILAWAITMCSVASSLGTEIQIGSAIVP